MPLSKLKIVSGGQTGADRAALDFAIEHGIPHSGWCPKGRRAEDGSIPLCYQLKEMATKAYKYRTEANVRDSDGTAILSIRPTVNGGSLNTILFTQKLGRPYLHLSRDGRTDGRACDPGKELRRFIKKNRIAVLNVAGSRDSEEPELAAWVKEVLKQALAS